MRWYTQNIDCLEERLGLNVWWGNSSSKDIDVVALHGVLNKVTCGICQEIAPLNEEILKSFKDGNDSTCLACQAKYEDKLRKGKRLNTRGLARLDIVYYDEFHKFSEEIADFMRRDIGRKPDLLLVLGTSLNIKSFNDMIKGIKRVRQAKTLLVYINRSECPSEWDNIFDYQLIGDCDDWIACLAENFDVDGCRESVKSKGIEMIKSSCMVSGTVLSSENSASQAFPLAVERNSMSTCFPMPLPPSPPRFPVESRPASWPPPPSSSLPPPPSSKPIPRQLTELDRIKSGHVKFNKFISDGLANKRSRRVEKNNKK